MGYTQDSQYPFSEMVYVKVLVVQHVQQATCVCFSHIQHDFSDLTMFVYTHWSRKLATSSLPSKDEIPKQSVDFPDPAMFMNVLVVFFLTPEYAL